MVVHFYLHVNSGNCSHYPRIRKTSISFIIKRDKVFNNLMIRRFCTMLSNTYVFILIYMYIPYIYTLNIHM